MSEWNEYKLGDIGTFFGGVTSIKREDYGFGTPFINYKNVYKNTKIDVSQLELMNVKKNDLEKRNCIYGDIFFTASSETPDEVAMSSVLLDNIENLTFNGFCKRFRLNDFTILNPNYARYLFRDNKFRISVYEVANGDIRYNISQESLSNIVVKLPSLSKQNAIAEILTSLDDKIELNNKVNQDLENLAQTLFKQWFIDFEFPNENGEPYKSSGGEMVESELGEIPKGWEVGSIYDISSVIYGAPFKSSLFNQERKGYPLIRIRDLKTFKPQNWTEEVLSKGTKIQPGDLVVGMDAEFRPHFWLGEEGWLNQRVCLFKPKSEFSRLFVREIIRPLLAFYENSSVGTTVIHLGKGDIDTFKSIIPSNHLSKLFTELSEPLINKIIENSRENESLRNLRDTLLPKLISGELEINEINN